MALFARRNHVRDALIALFKTPVAASNVVGRKMLITVLCNKAINFDKQILDFTASRRLEAMAKQLAYNSSPVVWETKERKDSNAKTVLSSINNDGQEILVYFLGTTHLLIHVQMSSMYVLMQL